MREPTVVGDRYVLGEIIGRGGMADVHRGEDRVLGRSVAVKVMRDLAGDPGGQARFTREARMLAGLSHPGLVLVLDAGTWQERPYLVMELVEGPTLADCCRGVALDPVRVAAIGAELASTLAYVHASGVVHRDIKPSNVLLDQSNRVRLADFGIARLLADTTAYTATGTTIGTAAYLAPEQVRGERVLATADIYALGLVLLEALTGIRAYQGSPTEAALARLSTPPAIPASLPEEWQVLLRQMTALEEGLRPTADEVGQRLRNLAAGADPSAATVVIRSHATATLPLTEPVLAGATAPEPVQPRGQVSQMRGRFFPRLRTVAAGVVVLILLLAAGLLVVQWSIGPNESSEVPANTPSRLKEPLKDLHDAVKGR